MSDRPILLRIMDDIGETLRRECPSLRGVTYDQPFDRYHPELPQAWYWDAPSEKEPEQDSTTTVQLATIAMISVAYPFSDRPGQTCHEAGHRLLWLELYRGLMKDRKRGRNDEASCALALDTRLTSWVINPSTAGGQIGCLDAFFEVDFLIQHNDPCAQ